MMYRFSSVVGPVMHANRESTHVVGRLLGAVDPLACARRQICCALLKSRQTILGNLSPGEDPGKCDRDRQNRASLTLSCEVCKC